MCVCMAYAPYTQSYKVVVAADLHIIEEPTIVLANPPQSYRSVQGFLNHFGLSLHCTLTLLGNEFKL